MPGSFATKADEEVVRQALKDKEAFAVLVGRYEERLKRYIRRLGVFRREDMEDILQNVFLKAYRNLNDFDLRLKFSSWIYRITHNETMGFFRSRIARSEKVLVGEESESLFDDIPAGLDLQRDIDRRLNGSQIAAALYELEPKYREVIVLRYFEEREYAEIFDILHIPIGTVGTLIGRAKKRLKDRLTRLK